MQISLPFEMKTPPHCTLIITCSGNVYFDLLLIRMFKALLLQSYQLFPFRPVLGNPSVASPGYGATVSVPVTWTGGPPASISRVVVYRLGGITHSVHMDQRQVLDCFNGRNLESEHSFMPNGSLQHMMNCEGARAGICFLPHQAHAC